jgi:hypothetical protein
MMFTLLHEQHKAQLKLMVVSNKQGMDTMFERMNALITGHGKAADKVTAPITNSNTSRAPSTMNHNKKRCTNCGKVVFHRPETCYELKTNASKHYPGWKLSKNASAPVWQGLGMSNNCISLVADNIVKTPANKNDDYWSSLSCLVKEQEDEEVEHTSIDHLLSAVTDFQPLKLQSKIAAKGKRKLKNWSSILDTSCTLGPGAKHNTDCFHNTGLPSKKVFMLPDKTKIKATNKMRLKHNIQPKASEMNIVPNQHSTLISVPKMADADYIAVFDKKEARIYDATTTIVSATKDPILIAPRCQDTGLWKLDLDYEVLGWEYPEQFIAGVHKANAIFDLPNTWQSLLYHHAAAGFPPKDTFLAVVWARNYATWPGLMTTQILKHFPNSDEMQKGHMKGQWKGVWLTKVTAPVTIKVEPGTANPPPPTIKKHYNIFVLVYKLLDTVHTDQPVHPQSYCNKAIGTSWWAPIWIQIISSAK